MRPSFVAVHKKIAARVALAGVLAVGGAAAIGACSTETTTDTPGTDAGIDDSAVATAICPATAPAAGSRCTLPEGTTCDFGSCGTRLAQCSGGTWRFGSNPPPRPACPEQPPDIEAPCPECWPAEATCVYGSQDCSAADASLNTSVASCVNRKWTLEVRPCRDAGADVQRDAGPDAD